MLWGTWLALGILGWKMERSSSMSRVQEESRRQVQKNKQIPVTGNQMQRHKSTPPLTEESYEGHSRWLTVWVVVEAALLVSCSADMNASAIFRFLCCKCVWCDNSYEVAESLRFLLRDWNWLPGHRVLALKSQQDWLLVEHLWYSDVGWEN